MTKIHKIIFCSLFILIMSVIWLRVIAPSASAQYTPVLTAKADNNNNMVDLSWNGSGDYHYMVYQKNDDEPDIYQSIPLKKNIKVLNIYPDVTGPFRSDLCQEWMNTYGNVNGYTMTVDKVSQTEFNDYYNDWLIDPITNQYKYDVLYFGGYDGNNGFDCGPSYTDTVRNAVEAFIQYGGGCLLGHDTALNEHTNFNYLVTQYLNMDTVYINDSIYPRYGDDEVVVNKQGLLMNYPYSLGSVGTILTTPMSHSCYQFAMGDVWFTYRNNDFENLHLADKTTSPSGKTGTCNFYLTTWNNMAMIQTGHSNGSATPDEQKILANTLYYLAQISGGTAAEDHMSQDVAAPDLVSSAVTAAYIYPDKDVALSWETPADNGSTYSYYIQAINNTDPADVQTSSETSAKVTSGIAGYAVSVDQSAVGDPGKDINTVTNSFNAENLDAGSYYAHIRAIDHAGNVSGIYNCEFTVAEQAPVAGSGRALSFDGTEYAIIPADGELDSASFTVEAWVQYSMDQDWSGIVDKGRSTFNNWFILTQQSGIRGVVVGMNGGNEIKYTWTGNDWHHVAITYDDSIKKFSLYIDGAFFKSLTVSGYTPADSIISLGRRTKANNSDSNFYPYKGNLDEVSIWDVARTGEQIKADRYRHLSGTETGLVSYYTMDETSGYAVNDSARDHTGTCLYASTNALRITSDAWANRKVESNQNLTIDAGYDISNNVTDFTTEPAVTNDKLTFDRNNLTVNYKSDLNYVGADSFTYRITNEAGYSDYTVNMNVIADITPPLLSSTFSYAVSGNDISAASSESGNIYLVPDKGTADYTSLAELTNASPKTVVTCNAGELTVIGTAGLTGSYQLYAADLSGNISVPVDVRLNSIPIAGFDTALSLNGSGYIDIGTNLVLNNSFTEEAWIYPTSADGGYHGFLGNHTGAPGTRAPSVWYCNYDEIHAGFGDTDSNWSCITTNSNIIRQNEWNHVAAVYDNGTYRIYINGILVFQQALNKIPCDTPVRMIGRVDNNFVGYIDEVRLWNKALSEATIREWMNKTVDPTHPDYGSLASYWSFNENGGTTVKDSTATYTGNFVGTGTSWRVSDVPQIYYIKNKGTTQIQLFGYDKDGDALTYEIVSGPSNGSLTPVSGSVYTYAHDGSNTLEDTVTYRVKDGTEYSGNTATIKIVIEPKAAAPVILPAAAGLDKGDKVTLSCTTAGAVIHYTVDGSTPTSASPVYSAPFAVTLDTAVRAIAVKTGYTDSEITSAEYTINKYLLTYQANGGNGAAMPEHQLVFSDKLTLDANTFTREYYNFQGWNTQPDGHGTVYADQSEFTMNKASVVLYAQWSAIAAIPSIISQPEDAVVTEGDSAVFEISAAASDGGALSYQWQKQEAGGITWNNIASVSGSGISLSNIPLSDDGSRYRCIVTNNKNEATADITSDSALLTVNASIPVSAQTPTIESQPADAVVTEGDSAVFEVSATAPDGGDLSYQWQKQEAGGATWNNVASVSGSSITLSNIPLSDNGSKYRCIVTNSKNGTTADKTSGSALLTVSEYIPVTAQTPVISSQPADAAVTEGASAVFEVSATAPDGGNLSYQWQKQEAGGITWNNVASVSGSGITLSNIPLSDNGSKYRCIVTNSKNGTTADKISDEAFLTVNEKTPEDPGVPSVIIFSGTVKDNLSNSVSGAAITLSNLTTGNIYHGISDFNGSYSIPGIPDGSYSLKAVTADGSESDTISIVIINGAITGGTADIIINNQSPEDPGTPGDPGTPVLPPAPPVNKNTASISGSVTDQNGNSLSGLTVQFTGSCSYSAMTDINGNYKISEVPDGSYTIQVIDRDGTMLGSGGILIMNGNIISGSPDISVYKKEAVTYTVTIKSGNTVIKTFTEVEDLNSIMISGLPDGFYTMEIDNGSFISTKLLQITRGAILYDTGTEEEDGRTQSRLEITDNTTIAVTVGGLTDLFNTITEEDSQGYTASDSEVVKAGGLVEIKLLVDEIPSGDNTEEQKQIDQLLPDNNTVVGLYLDLSILKTVTSKDLNMSKTYLRELPERLRVAIEIPDSLRGISKYRVYRIHNEQAQEISDNPTDSEYFTVEGNYIILYVSRFSTYAIAYSEQNEGQSGGNISGGEKGGQADTDNSGQIKGNTPGNNTDHTKDHIGENDNNGKNTNQDKAGNPSVIAQPTSGSHDLPDTGYHSDVIFVVAGMFITLLLSALLEYRMRYLKNK